MYLRLSKAVSSVPGAALYGVAAIAGRYGLFALSAQGQDIPYLGDAAFYDDHSGFGDRTAQVVS